ncbi:MAG: hypothetical protein EOP10_16745 [Proteobacteria bacterium]|nr:MAG: hypothetical protein EOP10_16745 [Pseudomonadota bacterium]
MLPKTLSLLQKVRLQVQDRFLQPKLGDVMERVSEAYRRRHYRHVFRDNEIAWVKIHGSKLRVLNLSYGGLRIERPGMNQVQTWLKVHQSIPVELDLLGETQKTEMVITSIDEESIGFSLDTRSPFSLLFLQRYLSFMDMGLSLKALSKNRVDKLYQSPQWWSYGTERGLVEVHMNADTGTPLPEIHVYLVNGKHFECVSFRSSGKITMSIKPKSELATAKKREMLSKALCVLVGMRQIGKSNRLDSHIRIAIAHLSSH